MIFKSIDFQALLINFNDNTYLHEMAIQLYGDENDTIQGPSLVVPIHESAYLLEWLHLLTALEKFQRDLSVCLNVSTLLLQICVQLSLNRSVLRGKEKINN